MAHHKSADPNVFILPDLGEGVHEAELIKWRVEVGQKVNEHDILAEMETDKALVEVPSPRAGVIESLHGKPGETLKVGNVLVTFRREDGAASRPAPSTPPAPSKSPEPASPRPAAEEQREDAGTVVGSMSASAPGTSATAGKALATPAVRRLARDLGVDIDSIKGTGIGGRVLERDVRAAAGARQAEPTPAPPRPPTTRPVEEFAAPPVAPPEPARAPARAPAPTADEVTRIPFRGVRRTIANRLRHSIDRAVHFTVVDEVDISALDGLRRRLAAASGEKVSLLPFVCSAVCRVLSSAEFRGLNATVEESDPEHAEIVQHRSIHLGIATDTESGLMVPVIRDADRMGVLEIGRAITRAAESARNRSIAREQLIGSTFTVSNVGSHAGKFATPVINYPEVAILGVGRAREGVVVEKGAIRVGLVLPLSLACDHRVVDGATAAMALARVIDLLRTPDQLLSPARS